MSPLEILRDQCDAELCDPPTAVCDHIENGDMVWIHNLFAILDDEDSGYSIGEGFFERVERHVATAYENQHFKMVDYLNDMSIMDDRLLNRIIRADDIERLKRYKVKDIDRHIGTATLANASRVLKELFRQRREKFRQLAMSAIFHRRIDMVKLFLADGVDHHGLLEEAVVRGSPSILRLLIESGVTEGLSGRLIRLACSTCDEHKMTENLKILLFAAPSYNMDLDVTYEREMHYRHNYQRELMTEDQRIEKANAHCPDQENEAYVKHLVESIARVKRRIIPKTSAATFEGKLGRRIEEMILTLD